MRWLVGRQLHTQLLLSVFSTLMMMMTMIVKIMIIMTLQIDWLHIKVLPLPKHKFMKA
jgi:hypothetical protein